MRPADHNSELESRKKILRRNLQVAIAKVASERLASASTAACERIIHMPEFAAASCVMVFIPMATELNSLAIAQAAWQTGKAVAVPKMDWAAWTMSSQQIAQLHAWPTPGDCAGFEIRRFGLWEPSESVLAGGIAGGHSGETAPDFVVVPGLGFDVAGDRLGRGGGFYDRFLGRLSSRVFAVGLALDEQIVPAIPVGPNDARVNAVATPTRLLRP